jgi:hypothetical protein
MSAGKRTPEELVMLDVPNYLTLGEASQQTGLSLRELHERLAEGRLRRRRPIIVSSRDLREEIVAHKLTGIRGLIADACGPESVDETMRTLGLEATA